MKSPVGQTGTDRADPGSDRLVSLLDALLRVTRGKACFTAMFNCDCSRLSVLFVSEIANINQVTLNCRLNEVAEWCDK